MAVSRPSVHRGVFLLDASVLDLCGGNGMEKSVEEQRKSVASELINESEVWLLLTLNDKGVLTTLGNVEIEKWKVALKELVVKL
jgi:hypothetical protein